jgi:hypothetical protein
VGGHDFELARPLLGRELRRRPRRRPAAAVDENIDRPEGQRRLRQPVDLSAIGEIEGNRPDARRSFRGERSGPARDLFDITRGGDNRRAFAQQRLGDRGAEAAAGAQDDGGPFCQS